MSKRIDIQNSDYFLDKLSTASNTISDSVKMARFLPIEIKDLQKLRDAATLLEDFYTKYNHILPNRSDLKE